MKTALTTAALAAFFTASAIGGGNVTVVNHGNHDIVLVTYDWDDGLRAAPADNTGSIRPGSSGTVTCRKSWTDSNAPGCYLNIKNVGGVMSNVSGKRKNGTWELKGSWDDKIYQDGVHYSEQA